jgi:hypothetical protein
MTMFRNHKTKIVVTLSEGGSKYLNQSAQHEISCKSGCIDR